MNYNSLIQSSINYIEENLTSVISLKDLAERSYLSPYHYHRVFKAVVGETLMDYVRRRRLTNAALEIVNTSKGLMDIAYEHQFSSQDVFSRAFNRMFGITPGKYRKLKPLIELYEKKNLENIQRSISSLHKTEYQPRIVVKGEFKIVGLQCTVTRDELSRDILTEEKWREHKIRKMHDNFFGNLQGQVKNKVPTSDCMAIYMRNQDNSLTDLACVEVSNIEEVPENMISRTIPSHKYAMFTFRANKLAKDITPFDLSNLIDYAYGEWLADSNYTLADTVSIEEWIPVENDKIQCHANIYIPIKG